MRQEVKRYFSNYNLDILLQRDFGMLYHIKLPLAKDKVTAHRRKQDDLDVGLEYVSGITPGHILEFECHHFEGMGSSSVADPIGTRMVLDQYCQIVSSNKSPFVPDSVDTDNKTIFSEKFHRPNVSLAEHPTLSARYYADDEIWKPVDADFAFRALYDIVDFEKFRKNALHGLCLVGNNGLAIQDTFVKFKDRV